MVECRVVPSAALPDVRLEEISFNRGFHAFKEAPRSAKAVLLRAHHEIWSPCSRGILRPVFGDLNARRFSPPIQGTDPRGRNFIRVDVQLAQMFAMHRPSPQHPRARHVTIHFSNTGICRPAARGRVIKYEHHEISNCMGPGLARPALWFEFAGSCQKFELVRYSLREQRKHMAKEIFEADPSRNVTSDDRASIVMARRRLTGAINQVLSSTPYSAFPRVRHD